MYKKVKWDLSMPRSIWNIFCSSFVAIKTIQNRANPADCSDTFVVSSIGHVSPIFVHLKPTRTFKTHNLAHDTPRRHRSGPHPCDIPWFIAHVVDDSWLVAMAKNKSYRSIWKCMNKYRCFAFHADCMFELFWVVLFRHRQGAPRF